VRVHLFVCVKIAQLFETSNNWPRLFAVSLL